VDAQDEDKGRMTRTQFGRRGGGRKNEMKNRWAKKGGSAVKPGGKGEGEEKGNERGRPTDRGGGD